MSSSEPYLLEGINKVPAMHSVSKTPQNLRANEPPQDGYLLSVDRKLKTRYDTSNEAVVAAEKLKSNFPAIEVAVFDVLNKSYLRVCFVRGRAASGRPGT